jgi:hypothetical protein
MVLSRIRTVKEEVEQDLYDMGLYFQDVQGRKSFPIEQWQAVKAWDHLMNGGSITKRRSLYYVSLLTKHRPRLPKQ